MVEQAPRAQVLRWPSLETQALPGAPQLSLLLRRSSQPSARSLLASAHPARQVKVQVPVAQDATELGTAGAGDAARPAVACGGERRLAAVAVESVAVAEARGAGRAVTDARDAGGRGVVEDAGRTIGRGGRPGTAPAGGVADARDGARLARRAADHPRTLAGVALAISVGVALVGVGVRGAVVEPVEDAVAVAVHRGTLDAKLDLQYAAIEEGREVDRVHGAKLLLAAHDINVGEAELARPPTRLPGRAGRAARAAFRRGGDEHPHAVPSAVAEAEVPGVPVDVVVAVLPRAPRARPTIGAHHNALRPRTGFGGEGGQRTYGATPLVELIDAHRRRGRGHEVPEQPRGGHHRGQEEKPRGAAVVKLVGDERLGPLRRRRRGRPALPAASSQ
jgi:hypothetical protein